MTTYRRSTYNFIVNVLPQSSKRYIIHNTACTLTTQQVLRSWLSALSPNSLYSKPPLFFIHWYHSSIGLSLFVASQLAFISRCLCSATLRIHIYIYNTIRYTFYKILRSVTTPRLRGLQIHWEICNPFSFFHTEGDVCLICTVFHFFLLFERIREFEGTCSVLYTLYNTAWNLCLIFRVPSFTCNRFPFLSPLSSFISFYCQQLSLSLCNVERHISVITSDLLNSCSVWLTAAIVRVVTVAIRTRTCYIFIEIERPLDRCSRYAFPIIGTGYASTSLYRHAATDYRSSFVRINEDDSSIKIKAITSQTACS